MKFSFWLCFLLCCCWSLSANALPPGQCLNRGFFEEISFELVRGKMIIPVRIRGKTYRFLFDTGGMLMISEQLQREWQFASDGTIRIHGVNGLSSSVEKVNIDLVEIGDLRFAQNTAMISPIFSNYPLDCFGLDGMIGRDFLKQMIVCMDLSRKSIIMTDRAHQLQFDSGQALRLKASKSGMPYITVKIKGIGREKVVFDSGSDDFFSFKTDRVRRLIKRKKLREDQVVPLMGVYSLGASNVLPSPGREYLARIEELRLRYISFHHFISDETKKSRSRMGTGLLHHGKVTLDYLQHKFYFEPFESFGHFERKNGFGFRIRPEEDRMVVAGVDLNGSAQRAGMKPGQRILMYGKLDFSQNRSYEDCATYLGEKETEEGDSLTVIFINDRGAAQSLTLQRIYY